MKDMQQAARFLTILAGVTVLLGVVAVGALFYRSDIMASNLRREEGVAQAAFDALHDRRAAELIYPQLSAERRARTTPAAFAAQVRDDLVLLPGIAVRTPGYKVQQGQHVYTFVIYQNGQAVQRVMVAITGRGQATAVADITSKTLKE